MTEGLAGFSASRLFKRQTVLICLAAVVVLVIFLIHLGSQPSVLKPAEQAAVNHSRSFHSIVKNPINAPHDILSSGLGHIGHGLFWYRLSSVVWSIVFILGFFSLAKALFGQTIGLIGTVVFAATPLMMVASRQASADIMLASPVLVMAVFYWLTRQRTNSNQVLPLLVIITALAVYIPGMIWWLAGAGIIGWRRIRETASSVTAARLYMSLMAGLVLLLPLLLALASNTQLIKPLALVPGHFGSAFTELKDIVWMAAAWFVKTPFHSPLMIERLPVLNIVQDVLLVFGAYALFQAARSKAWTHVGAIVFATVAAGLNNNLSLLLLGLPSASLLIATGLRFLYVEWRGVFPRNPAAKYIAILLIASLGTVQLLYGVRYAIVAWPHTVASHSSSVLK